MITGELKNKIDGMWDVFAAGGLVNYTNNKRGN